MVLSKPARVVLCSSIILLSACSGDARPLTEAVEANDLQLQSINVVQPPGLLADLVVNPGTLLTFTLIGTDLAELPVAVSSFNRRWSVSDPAVASIDEDGNLIALGEGTAFVSVRVGGIASDAFEIEVRDETLASIETIIGPDAVERCLPGQYRAEGRFLPVNGTGDGSLRGLLDVEWSVENPQAGSVGTPVGGVVDVNGVNVGSLTLVATAEELSSSRTIEVQNTLQEITIGPVNAAVELGNSLQLVAEGRYVNEVIERTVDITDTVQWGAAEDNGILTVGNTALARGLVSTVAVGNAVVTAACGDLAQLRTVVVIDNGSTDASGLSFASGDSLTLSLAAGPMQLQLSTGFEFDDEEEITDDTDTEFSVIEGEDIVTFNSFSAQGVITPLAIGTATVRATFGSQFQDLDIQVVP